MANVESVTTCNGIKLKPGVEKYLRQFQIIGEDITCNIDNEGHFSFYGYCWPSIYKNEDEDLINDVTDEFFSGLKRFVPKGKRLEIQTISHCKCCWPLSAQHFVITSRRVTYKPLN